MDSLDKILQSIGTVTTNYIDTWGRVQVAHLDAQVQPPPVYASPSYMSAVNTTTLMILGIVVVGAIVLLKK